ncbi:MAG: thiolase domain-containing protein [Thaumarchaeota archaeon]|nr:thiolase domain-containing protein [Candidatus Calditenuaceae archaeon]MDW8041702.1 thiolase domain-containing protein [Nitrososphaerota archaeon]
MSRRVAIVGIGLTPFGKRSDASISELAFEAGREAIRDAGVDAKDIGFLAVGNAGGWSAEALPAVLISEYLGLDQPGSLRVEAACATGSAAIKVAYDAITSGSVDVAMALGVERMNESPTPTVVELIGRAGNYFWEFENFGLTFPGYYAIYATAYMDRYGAKEEDIAEVAVKNHYYGSMNPYAQFQKPVKLEEVMSSRYIAWPLKLLECSPITDGAAAAVLASEEVARKLTDSPVWIKGMGYATGTANLSKRADFLGLEPASRAAKAAYAQAGIDPSRPYKQIDVATVHDCFSIAEILAYEDLGFARRGEGYMLLKEHQTHIGGLIPVNLDGGLKSKGHPIGATGVGMAVEAVKQLRRKAERGRQADVKNGVALAHNVGGTGHYAYVTVYSID